jgi:hypothetical protein
MISALFLIRAGIQCVMGSVERSTSSNHTALFF